MSDEMEWYKTGDWKLTIEGGYATFNFNLIPFLTIYKVEERIAEIRGIRDDPEMAHAKEKELWGDVLEAISGGIENPRELAKECLKTKDIKFSRWFA